MSNIVLNLLRGYLYLVLSMLFLSFAGSATEIIAAYSLISTVAFVLWCLHQQLIKKFDSPNFLTNFLAVFFVWLLIQRLGALFGLPFFELVRHWSLGMDFYHTLWGSFVTFLVCQHVLKTRQDMSVFVKFWVFISAGTAAFFIYLFYTSGVIVEALNLPHVLKYFGAARFQPNNVIDLFIPGSFFALSIVFYNYRRKLSHSNPSRCLTEMILYLMMSCILIAAILYTKSRAGIVAYGAALVVYFFLFILSHRRKKSVVKLVSSVLVLILIMLSTLGIREVFQELMTIRESLNSEISSMGVRSMSIGAAWQLILSQGALGVGVGNFQMGWLLHHSAPFTSFPQVSFNDLFWFWAEMGFLGFAFFSLIVLVAVGFGIYLAKKSESSFISYLAASMVASITAFMAHSCIDVTLYVPTLMIMFFFFIGIVSALKSMEVAEIQEGVVLTAKRKTFHPLIFLIFVLIGGVLTFHSVQSFRALWMTNNSEDVDVYIKASEIDKSSPYYPRRLSYIYFSDYLETKNDQTFDLGIEAIDEAIKRSPFSMTYYSKRAEMFLERQDLQGIQKSFELADEFAPGFYLVDLAASAFYMNVSLELVNPQMISRFQALAMRHYAQAMKANPRLSKDHELFLLLNPPAREAFTKLLEKA